MTAGTAQTVRAQVDGQYITNTEPTITVVPGPANETQSTYQMLVSEDVLIGQTRTLQLSAIYLERLIPWPREAVWEVPLVGQLGLVTIWQLVLDLWRRRSSVDFQS